MMFLGLIVSLTSCETGRILLHPVTLVNGDCRYQGEDICYPATGYTAFSDYYLQKVIEVKIEK